MLVPVEKYLGTIYHPDREYVDGAILQRNLGERDHSSVQRELIYFFRTRQKKWRAQRVRRAPPHEKGTIAPHPFCASSSKAYAYPEQRVQVSPTRFRVPDICVFAGEEPQDQIFRTAPFICIEILSPEDRWEQTQEQIDDYLNFGVPHVWVLNPRQRRAWSFTKSGSTEIIDGRFRTVNPAFEIPLRKIFGQP